MSHSEDEDDFLSADEDVDCNVERCDTKSRAKSTKTIELRERQSSNTEVIHDMMSAMEEAIPDIELEEQEEEKEKAKEQTGEAGFVDDVEPNQKAMGGATPNDDDKADDQNEDDDDDERQDDNDNEEDEEEEDDEEAALAERIRERNLKIARNFSVEIAKNLKASAPIPVKASPASARREREYSEHTLSGPDLNGSTNPPAPPSTPALSSSFSNLSEQTNNQNTSDTSPSLRTQYSWRLPPRTAAQPSVPAPTSTSCTTTTSISSSSSSSPSPFTSPSLVCEAKLRTNEALQVVDGDGLKQSTVSAGPNSTSNSSERARLALDRLADRLSQPDGNLFERVAADIRNMSITGDDEITAADVTSQLGALPSTISDLGSTLGGWGWSGASKLLSSATQVTSQVGSVLNSIVDGAQVQPAATVAAGAPGRREMDDGPAGAPGSLVMGSKGAKND